MSPLFIVPGRASILVLLFCFTLALGLDLMPWLSFYDEKRVLQLLGLLLFVVLAVPFWGTATGSYWPGNIWLKGGLAAVVVLMLLSMLQAEYFRYALLELSLLCMLFISVLLLAEIASQDYRFVSRMVIFSLLTGVFYYVLVNSVYYVSAIIEGGSLTWQAMLYNFSNVRFLNQIQVWLLPLLLVLLWFGERLPRSLVLLSRIAIVGWIVLLINSGGAGIAVAIIVSFSLVACIGTRGRQFSFLALRMLLYGMIIHWLLFYLVPELVNGNGSYGDKVVNNLGLGLRDHLWIAAWEQIKSNPLLGIGPMHYAANGVAFAMHPHNAILQLAAEWGLPLTLLLIVLSGFAFLRWLIFVVHRLRCPEDLDDMELVQLVALTASMVGAAVLAMVSGVLVMPLSQLCLVVVVGMSLGLYRKHTKSNREDKVSRIQWVSVILLMVFIGGSLVWAVAPDIKQRFLGKNPDSSFPRFWQHGKIGEFE